MGVWDFLLCILGLGRVSDGSVCEFSRRFFDVHDYHVIKGGDGFPSHFHEYTCSACHKKFFI
jgi:hypothetical protein